MIDREEPATTIRTVVSQKAVEQFDYARSEAASDCDNPQVQPHSVMVQATTNVQSYRTITTVYVATARAAAEEDVCLPIATPTIGQPDKRDPCGRCDHWLACSWMDGKAAHGGAAMDRIRSEMINKESTTPTQTESIAANATSNRWTEIHN